MSSLLVIAQFAAITWLAAMSRAGDWGIAAVALLLAGVALGVSAITINRPGNFNIRPEPKAGARLATRGPYRWIRHPMYSALMLAAAAVVVARPGLATLAGAAVLSAVLVAKALREERGLLAVDPGYRDYTTRTHRFVPWLI